MGTWGYLLISIRNAASTKRWLSPVQQWRGPVQNKVPKKVENGQQVSQLGPPHTRVECLKCKSEENSVRRFPLCVPGRRESPKEANKQSWRILYRSTEHEESCLSEREGDFFATVDGITNVDTLLDSELDCKIVPWDRGRLQIKEFVRVSQ